MPRAATLISFTILLVVALAHPLQAKELRIGLVAPLTGILAPVGKDMVNGFQLYLDAHADAGAFGGATVTFTVEDSGGNPETGAARAEKLIDTDKVHLIVGGALAAADALAPVSTARKTVYIASAAGSDALTRRNADKYPYLIRTGAAYSQAMHPLGQWACEQGYGRIAAIAVDDAFGYEQVGGFQSAFEECGGQIIQKIWAPIDTRDFGASIKTISEDADAVLSVMAGPMARHFPSQFRRSGRKTPILGSGITYDESALPYVGREVIGDVSALHYSAALETPKNEAFVKDYRSRYDKAPSSFSEGSYTTAQLIDETMRQSGGEWPGAEKFAATMVALRIDAVRGPVAFDVLRNPVQNVYVRRVERKRMFGAGRLESWNSVINTYPTVSQFWTYDKDAVLRLPGYTRDFPPCKYCDGTLHDSEAR